MNKPTEILPLLKGIVKQAMEQMIRAERRMYLETNGNTKANGYYTRDLGTPIGMMEAIKRLLAAGMGALTPSFCPTGRDIW